MALALHLSRRGPIGVCDVGVRNLILVATAPSLLCVNAVSAGLPFTRRHAGKSSRQLCRLGPPALLAVKSAVLGLTCAGARACIRMLGFLPHHRPARPLRWPQR